MTLIKLRSVSKSIPVKTSDPDEQAVFAVKDVDLTVSHGQIMVILGPSGCGKSTLLRLIAGLSEPDSGQVLYNGEDMIDIPTNQRQIGMVFQDYALYPQQTAEMNILAYFNFRRKHGRLSPEAWEKYERTSRLMGVDIDHLLHKMPGSLSGGERQKVAIARCITRNPELFLMDEPFANIDQKLREKYRVQLKRLLREFSITTVYVTHDQQEALALADVIAIMRAGQIEQVGPPRSLYALPKNLFVAEFLNFDQATPAINLFDGEAVAPALGEAVVGVRPEEMSLCGQKEYSIHGVVTDVTRMPLNRELVAAIEAGGREIGVRLPADSAVDIGDSIHLCFDHYHLFDSQTGHVLKHVA